ncbi:bifunctional serine/threonine-protein kinase/formylglycine-generating enzyme family protein [Teredinibacter purpureus]|uniref:bifunctional serine/threonine-protein kinase/formylglycine-generating enzyme family protein n=1 Tax=Teredinibacter purpureus TaxID=2731756 RepID=UPI00069842E3|nr:bifunctional serine/threonine-protein kinase/formylglycine-generating enzyme family protein [Teredinibacter purpureus]
MNLHALQPGYMLGEYQIEKLLGEGGFGLTYLAVDTNVKRKVAIKEYMPSDFAWRKDGTTVVAKTQDTENDYRWGLDAFLKESQTVAKFDDPNIVRVHRFFQANGTAYLVMEYCEGGCLSDRFSKGNSLSEEAVRSILTPIMNGLQLVHDAGVLHRDIKPDNIMFRTDGTPVLIDFGAARQAIGAKSRSITTIISPGYAPREQYASKGQMGAYTDIYALAAVAYACLTGGEPEDAMDRMDNDTTVKFGERPGASAFLKSIDWGLAMSPSARPQTLGDWFASWGGMGGQGESLTSLIDIAGADGIITSAEMNSILTQAEKLGIEQAAAQQQVVARARAKGWTLKGNGVSSPAPAPKAKATVKLSTPQKPEKTGGAAAAVMIVLIILFAGAAAAAVYYFKYMKPAQQYMAFLIHSTDESYLESDFALLDFDKGLVVDDSGYQNAEPYIVSRTDSQLIFTVNVDGEEMRGRISKTDDGYFAKVDGDEEIYAAVPMEIADAAWKSDHTDDYFSSDDYIDDGEEVCVDHRYRWLSETNLETVYENGGSINSENYTNENDFMRSPDGEFYIREYYDAEKAVIVSLEDYVDDSDRTEIDYENLEFYFMFRCDRVGGEFVLPMEYAMLSTSMDDEETYEEEATPPPTPSPTPEPLYSLWIETTPNNARVVLPDQPSNVTYYDGIDLSAGQHRVVIKATGYRSQTLTVDLSSESRSIAVELLPLRQDYEPIMVNISGGSFRMGDTTGDGHDDEKPAHTVNVSNFSMGKYEVTRGQFRQFVDATGYVTDAENNTGDVIGCDTARDGRDDWWDWTSGVNWKNADFEEARQGGDNHPVVCVSWNDVNAYIDWLNKGTSGGYRLPSEAEWEYAARAGSSNKFHFGNEVTDICTYGNIADTTDLANDFNWSKKIECDDNYSYTSPVGRYASNGFGLYDIYGNVFEWTADCWNENYEGAPTDGSAWDSGNCGRRVRRGGSFDTVNIGSSYRNWSGRAFRSSRYGFRVVQDK